MAQRICYHPTQLHPSLPEMDIFNAAILFITSRLEVFSYNALASELLNVDDPHEEPIHLDRCLSPESEEYHILSGMIAVEKELRDTIVIWELNGQIRHLLVDSFIRRSEQGLFLGMFVILKDLGNFVALEQQVHRDEKMDTIGKIAAGIAHEIRNPLTTVRGFLQMMEKRFAAQQMSDEVLYAKMMMDEVEKVNLLVGQLLLLSRPHKMVLKPYFIKDVLDNINNWIEPLTKSQNIDYECHVEENIVLEMDRDLLEQMVIHLAKNAIEAMENGGKLKIACRPAGAYLELDVSDTGPGIPYYQMDKIFDAFYTTKKHGIGLGLSICQRIVADHGGEIRVSSKGFGSTFHIRIPIHRHEIVDFAID